MRGARSYIAGGDVYRSFLCWCILASSIKLLQRRSLFFLQRLVNQSFSLTGIRNLQDIELVWQSSQKTMNKTVKVPIQRLKVVWSKNLIRDKECKRWLNRFRYNYLQNWWSTDLVSEIQPAHILDGAPPPCSRMHLLQGVLICIEYFA